MPYLKFPPLVRAWGTRGARAVLAASAVLALAASSVSAQTPGFNAERFEPAAGASGGLRVERALVPEHLGFGVGLFVNYADDALVVRTAGGSLLSRPLSSNLSANLLASLALFDFAELALDLPVHLIYRGDALAVGGQPAPQLFGASAGIGDLRLVPKVAFRKRGDARLAFSYGFALPITLPTGDGQALRGAGGITVEPKLLLGLRGRRWGSFLNAGFRLRPDAGTTQLAGNEVTFGLGGSYAVLPKKDLLDALLELTGGRYLSPNRPGLGSFPLELLVGAALKPHPDWTVYLSGGPGFGSGLGAPDFRFVGGVRFSPSPTTDFRDADHDGVADAFDRCSRKPEDQDGFEDRDGCPDDDNDADGILDDNDECPDTPEGAQGNGDGCPDHPTVLLQEGQILIVGKVQFQVGSSKLLPFSEETLDRVAEVLKAHPELQTVHVDGHTDETGAPALNQSLSEQRAVQVRQGLVDRGIEAERLVARGFGASHPIAPNATRAGRAKNRRVEFTTH